VAGKLYGMDFGHGCYFYGRGVINLKDMNMWWFILGLFVGACLGTLAVGLCVAAKRGDERGQPD
jgi:MFS-type transporter involved in bile tolerance (Atg22 family)